MSKTWKNMRTFKLDIFDGHAIIHHDNFVILIDTGSTSTLHVNDSLNFIKSDYPVLTNYLGMTVESLSELLGMKITTLLGNDVLRNYRILFDYKCGKVDFIDTDTKKYGEEIHLSSFMNIPIAEFIIGNQNLKFFLDTGAKLSYLSEKFTSSYESIGTKKDFYPLIGRFETECFIINTSLSNKDFEVTYGILPEAIEMLLMLGQADGIMGYDFFNNFRIMLDLTNNRLQLKKQTD